MSELYNIYCDESCHLENDKQKAMVLGAIWCPTEKAREIAVRIREIKTKHKLAPNFEIKWTKVSPAKREFYLDLIDYFFDTDNLHFRGLIIPDKSLLRHDQFNQQSHDEWYYKMYFDMLKVIFKPDSQYRVYIDIKDTQGAEKIRDLHDVLSHSRYDFSKRLLQRFQLVHSHEIEQLQLADLLIGAIGYLNRGLNGSETKLAIIQRIQKRSHYNLTQSTLYREEKINLLRWQAQEFVNE